MATLLVLSVVCKRMNTVLRTPRLTLQFTQHDILPSALAPLPHPRGDGVTVVSQRQLSLCLQQKTAGKQGFDRNPPWLSSFAPNTKRHVCCMQQLHTDCLLPVLHCPGVVDYYPGIKLDVTSPNPMSPGLNTVGEDFIIETSAVMWTSVSEAFPPCQEK